MPNRLCFTNFRQLDQFVQRMNEIRRCSTPGCRGDLVPLSIKTKGLGGAVTIPYACKGCGTKAATFESSPGYELDSTTEIGLAVQVAFVISGCMYSTYQHVLRHALGIDAVSEPTLMSTIQLLYPVVKQMVDEMCMEAKEDMQKLDSSLLGSWKRAVTSADGAWQTRGFHSKNATFSIRNYCNGALLYYEHLCQRGRDDIVEGDLYPGTSKSAEGYAARQNFKRAKDEGMIVEVQWQDADSSSANAVAELFPDAQVMTCGGHAGRAHKKQLETLSKSKSFSVAYQDRHRSDFPQVKEVTCCCVGKKHKQGCGCLSEAFVERARNNFSSILMEAQSAEEFAERLRALPRHARDEHEWEGGQCSFHPMRVCSCGECDKGDLKCEGKPYRTRHLLSCPLHSLAYEIECDHRASMANQLVHPVLKRGHSNWLEASHSVFIRFRPKHIQLERLHYETSTNLGLLQSNMTYMYTKRGPSYHWIPDLYQRLKLPVYTGLQEVLEKSNQERKEMLDTKKTEKSKKRRIECKRERTKDSQKRKEWSKKHGHDTYGDADDLDSEAKPRASKQVKKSTGGGCKCGSTTHKRSNHRDCPLNPKFQAKPTVSPVVQPKNNPATAVTDNLYPGKGAEDLPPHDSSGDEERRFSDDLCLDDELPLEECFSSDDSLGHSDWSDDDIVQCTCRAEGRAHKRGCPMNSRQYFSASVLESDTPSRASVPKRKRRVVSGKADTSEPPPKKGRGSVSFDPGDYVCIHSRSVPKYHVPCRVVEVFDKQYRLCCIAGVLSTCIGVRALALLSGNCSIPLHDWRTAKRVKLSEVVGNPNNLANCDCTNPTISEPIILDSEACASRTVYWVDSDLYKLEMSAKSIIERNEWLTYEITKAAQSHMSLTFPHVSGLQPTVLQQTRSFQVHIRPQEFVQIIHVEDNHWCVVTNVGCEDGVVSLYDSMRASVTEAEYHVIASLVFCSSSDLTVRMMDVEKQQNTVDCGVLSIAYAFDICSGFDPCKVVYDHRCMREHLLTCLENVSICRFPILASRTSTGVKGETEIELFCVCRLPEEEGVLMACCSLCGKWYHNHCVDVPRKCIVDVDEPWLCPTCSQV